MRFMLPLTAIPILPTVNIAATVDFYAALGFGIVRQDAAPEPGVVLRAGELQLIFYLDESLRAEENKAGFYLRVENVDDLYEDLRRRLGHIVSPLESHPWGMREFHLVDNSGNLIRIGQPIEG